VDVSVGQTDVVAATTDDDRVVERGATAIGAPARQVSHCGVGVVVDGAGVKNRPCMGEPSGRTRRLQTKRFHRQSNNEPPVCHPSEQFFIGAPKIVLLYGCHDPVGTEWVRVMMVDTR
jgi:hypothetical protein